MKWRWLLLALPIACCLGLWLFWRQSPWRVQTVTVAGMTLHARVADAPWEWSHGLSDTPADASEAQKTMVFFFPDAAIRPFWMKDMQFPLDIYWVADGQVIGVSRAVPPPLSSADRPETVTPPGPVDTVIEIPAKR